MSMWVVVRGAFVGFMVGGFAALFFDVPTWLRIVIFLVVGAVSALVFWFYLWGEEDARLMRRDRITATHAELKGEAGSDTEAGRTDPRGR